MIHASAQDRVAVNELPTGYTLVNTVLAYRMAGQFGAWEVLLRLNNIFDKEAREHTSPLKDIAPLPGRGVLVGLRGSL